MPYEWVKRPKGASEKSGAPLPPGGAEPLAELHLWPYRSLPRRGFVWVIGGMAVLLSLPLIEVLGSPVLWGLLPFVLAALWGLWFALNRSYRDGEILERLTLWPDRVDVLRDGPRRAHSEWHANPHWVRVDLHRREGPVPNYLTLSGAGREIEIGAFLSEEERLSLWPELADLFRRA